MHAAAAPSAPPPSAPRPARMHVHLATLAFRGEQAHLEQPFLDDYFQGSLLQLRIALVLGAALYGSFALLDQLLFPQQRAALWLIRFGVVWPTVLLVLAASFRPWFRRSMQPLLSMLSVVAGAGIAAMIVIVPPPGSYEYYAGLILVLIFSYTFLRARFAWASLSGLLIVLAYEVAVLGFTRAPSATLLGNSFFLVSANLAGMATCYSMEYVARRTFFLHRLLVEEQERVQLANRMLETRVLERTAALSAANAQLQAEMAERQRGEEERLRLQQQLKQAERLEAIGRLAAGVAHDLNNILTGLVTYPDVLLMDLPEESPLRAELAPIKQSGLKAAAIVRDLLALSRQGTAEHQVVQLNPIVLAYLGSPELLQLKATHPHVRLETALEADLLNLKGAPVQLSKVVMNLVHNAFEANLVAGEVKVATQNRYLDRPLEAYQRIPEGEYVVLAVSDTGVGIAAEDLHRIFDPFFSKKKLGRSGTGLGLTLIGAALEEHGGAIDVRSEEGVGTTFELWFPATREAAAPAEGTATLEECQGTERVLVVDDVPEQREIATRMLRKLGYDARAAASGEEALALLPHLRPDLLVLDMVMEPGIDGCETYRRALEVRPGQRAVIASGYAASERVEEAQRLGAGAWVQKPYTLERIARAIRGELGRGPA